jgi:hypothetical protein
MLNQVKHFKYTGTGALKLIVSVTIHFAQVVQGDEVNPTAGTVSIPATYLYMIQHPKLFFQILRTGFSKVSNPDMKPDSLSLKYCMY